jgi:hypothetical protein
MQVNIVEVMLSLESYVIWPNMFNNDTFVFNLLYNAALNTVSNATKKSLINYLTIFNK